MYSLNERDGALRIKVKRDAGECARRVLRLFLKESDATGGVRGDGIVFFNLLQIAHVVKRKDGRVFLAAEFSEIAQLLAEQVVASDNDEVVIHVLSIKDVMDVADGAELLVSSVVPSLTR